MMKNDVEIMFRIYPMDVGIPWKEGVFRREIHNKEELNDYIKKTNGVASCYVSVYDTNKEMTLDKFVFDLDDTNISIALEDAKELVRRVRLPWTVLFSGKKGFHVYVFLSPVKLRRDIARYYLKKVQDDLSSGLKTVDPHVKGDVSRIIRIPNTLNGGRYCTFLPPEFLTWDINQVLEWSRITHGMLVSQSDAPLKTIEELAGNVEIPDTKPTEIDDEIGGIPSIGIIKQIIRPCIVEEMLNPVRKNRGPFHITRMNFVMEMKYHGFTQLQIFKTMKQFDFIDYDSAKTQYQIEKISEYVENSGGKPHGCKRLKEKLGDRCTRCSWVYCW